MARRQSNVAQLHANLGKPKQQQPLISQRRKRRALVLIGIIAVVTLFLGIQLISTKSHLNQVNAQIRTEKSHLKKQKATAKDLKQKTKLLKNENYVKDLAHSKYGYAQKGETTYRLSSDKQSNNN
ncbi:FtsB family cell division protein [Fructilactobacillus frigidiflavus]|uniref:FtsB family cell division protein n=1 Tax=Fructilactobacillus frigidiflavus TaxID=3242688 RepID=UPI003756D1D9